MCHLKRVSMVSIITFVTMISMVNRASIYFLVTMSTFTKGCTNVPTVTCVSLMSRLPKMRAYNYANLPEHFLLRTSLYFNILR